MLALKARSENEEHDIKETCDNAESTDSKSDDDTAQLDILCSSMPEMENAMTFSQYLIASLFRHHCLEINERQMVLSGEDQLLTTQLCLAEINKEVRGKIIKEIRGEMDEEVNWRLTKG